MSGFLSAGVTRARAGGTRMATKRKRSVRRAAVGLMTRRIASDGQRAPRRDGATPVLLVGDSITGNYGATAGGNASARGYEVEVRAYPNQGLLDAAWCRGLIVKQLRQSLRPDIVVFEMTGNYLSPPPCKTYTYGSVKWIKAWKREARSGHVALHEEDHAALLGLEPSGSS